MRWYRGSQIQGSSVCTLHVCTELYFFLSGNIFRRHLSENELLEYSSTTKMFLHQNIFSFGYLEWELKHVVRTRGVNSGMWWEGELNSAAVNNCKCEGIISMVP